MSDAPANPCGTCGRCCRDYVVPLYGRDIWLISTRQRLNPEDFVVAIPEPKQHAACFTLESEGSFYTLALDKKGRFKPRRPCIFLVELSGGYSRCGIYSHRPLVCQVYPMELFRQIVYQRRDAHCPPGAWSESEPRRPLWREKLRRNLLHFDVYSEVVARWNARMARAPKGTAFTLSTYLNYLYNVYHRLAELDQKVGEEKLARIEATWAEVPESGDLTDEGVDRSSYPWISYLAAARQIIDSFYPEIEPLPSIVLQRATNRSSREASADAIPPELRGALAKPSTGTRG